MNERTDRHRTGQKKRTTEQEFCFDKKKKKNARTDGVPIHIENSNLTLVSAANRNHNVRQKKSLYSPGANFICRRPPEANQGLSGVICSYGEYRVSVRKPSGIFCDSSLTCRSTYGVYIYRPSMNIIHINIARRLDVPLSADSAVSDLGLQWGAVAYEYERQNRRVRREYGVLRTRE